MGDLDVAPGHEHFLVDRLLIFLINETFFNFQFYLGSPGLFQ